jgi:hypothetical protein
VGLFPGIGEAHLNGLAGNRDTLTTGLWIADYSLRPLFITLVNALELGLPTLADWLLEPYSGYDPAPGTCEMSLLGYCKSARLVPEKSEPDR